MSVDPTAQLSSGKEFFKRLRAQVHRPRSVSPRPPSPPTQLANPVTGPVSATSSADAHRASHPAPSSYAAGSTVSKQNLALAAAIEKHLAGLPNAEKDAFRNASRTIDEKTMLDRISTFDRNHHDASSFRQCAPKLEATLRLVEKFMAGISIAIQTNPDPSSIVVGAVRVVLDVAIGFVEFFLPSLLISWEFPGPACRKCKSTTGTGCSSGVASRCVR